MKIRHLIGVMLLFLFIIGCKNNNEIDGPNSSVAYESKPWKEKTFFSSVPVPSVDVDRLSQDYNKNGRENYSVIINNFSYSDFYEYIMKLENDGYHYEFVDEYVPKKNIIFE